MVLLKYYDIAKTLIDNFKCFKMYYILRESNTRADLLSKLASTKKVGHLKTIIQPPCHQSGASCLPLANTQGKPPQLYQEVQAMPRVCIHSTHSF